MPAFIITFSLPFFHDATYYNFDIRDCDMTDYTETVRHINQELDNMSKWFLFYKQWYPLIQRKCEDS